MPGTEPGMPDGGLLLSNRAVPLQPIPTAHRKGAAKRFEGTRALLKARALQRRCLTAARLEGTGALLDAAPLAPRRGPELRVVRAPRRGAGSHGASRRRADAATTLRQQLPA